MDVYYDAGAWDPTLPITGWIMSLLSAIVVAVLILKDRGVRLLGKTGYRIGIVLFVSSIWGVTAWNIVDGMRQAQAANSGDCRSVEGVVRVLQVEPWGGHAGREQVEIGGETIEYSHFVADRSFAQTSARGGPLVDGAYARLCIAGDKILRVELRHGAR